MLDVKPYFCSECGKTHNYKDFKKNEGNKRCCSNCEGTRICLSGWALMMIAATIGLVYILPNIVGYKLGLTDGFKLGLMRGDPYIFMPSIILLALVSVLRIVEMKIRQKNPLPDAERKLGEKKLHSAQKIEEEAGIRSETSSEVKDILKDIETTARPKVPHKQASAV